MNQKEAELAYAKEWPPLNAMKQEAVIRGDHKTEKRMRQALSALSIKYKDRHIVEPPPITIGERLDELEKRIMSLERGS